MRREDNLIDVREGSLANLPTLQYGIFIHARGLQEVCRRKYRSVPFMAREIRF